MENVTHRNEGVVMLKRFLGALTVALALAVAIPVHAALAMHVIDGGGSASKASVPVVSPNAPGTIVLHKSGVVVHNPGLYPSLGRDFSLGQAQTPTAARSRPVGSEVSTGIQSPSVQSTPTTASSRPVGSEVSTGIQSPFVQSTPTSAPASNDSGFNWGDAGIGAAVLLASLLVATAGALTLRRLRPIAH
jgi:hypothetical protein